MNEHADLSRLYRQAGQPEPSAALDDAILGAARQAAQGAPRPVSLQQSQTQISPQPQARPGRWRVPFAIAATALLSATVTLLVHDQQASVEAGYGAPQIAPADANQANHATQADARPAAMEAVPSAAPGAVVAAAPRPASPAAKAAVPAMAPAPAAPSQGLAPDSAMKAAPAFAPEPAPVARREALADVAEARNAAPAASAAAVAPAIAGGSVAAFAAPESRPRAAMAAKALAPAAAASVADSAADKRSSEARSPESWVAEIRELRRQGQNAEAERRLAELRRAYPGYPLPEDLKPH